MDEQKSFEHLSPAERYTIAEQRIADAKANHQTWLDLGDLGLDEIPDSLGELTQLEILSLGLDLNRPISTFRSAEIICQLMRLKTLDLSCCRYLTELPERFGQLKGLNALDLSFCVALTAMPESFGQLRRLERLSLSFCVALTAMPVSFSQLKGLKELNLNHCRALTVLPENFCQLIDLETLKLAHSQWFSHDMLVNMAHDFSCGKLPKLKKLDLSGTNVQLPTELIASNSAKAIFEHVLKAGKTRLRIAKVLLVGIGEAGKSHLLQRLYPEESAMRNYFDPVLARTKGIDERTIALGVDRPEIRLWDFGGQMHLHSIHRFFLGADHCAYILVLDATKDASSNRLNYWLRFISHHGTSERNETHSRTPVLIVLNKCDVIAVAKEYPKWSQSQTIIENNKRLLASLAIAKEQQWYGANVIGECIVGLGNFDKSTMHSDTLYGSFNVDIPHAKHQKIAVKHSVSLDEIEARLQIAFDVMPGVDVEYAKEFHRLRDYVDSQFATADVS